MVMKFDFMGISGFSDQLLKNHITLYEGYVANTAKLSEALKKMIDEGRTAAPEFAELSRRFGWEWNGMRLHELYFGNLRARPLSAASKLRKAIIDSFGSMEAWEKSFKAVGAMRGIGWAVLYYDPQDKKLYNQWVNEHDAGHMSGAVPLLIMDVFEHAFMIDYGLKRADYIEAFFREINWDAVDQRFKP